MLVAVAPMVVAVMVAVAVAVAAMVVVAVAVETQRMTYVMAAVPRSGMTTMATARAGVQQLGMYTMSDK